MADLHWVMHAHVGGWRKARCNQLVMADQTTDDPSAVTCAGCRRWLSSHVAPWHASALKEKEAASDG